MKKLEIVIKFEIKGDPQDRETLTEDIYQYLQGVMEEGDLEFEVNEDEDSDLEDEYDLF